MALGREIVIAKSDGAGTFTPVAVVESRSLEINNEEIDTTKPDPVTPGNKLAYSAMYGTQSLKFSGSGAYVDSVTAKAVTADVMGQVVDTYQITVPSVGTFEGDCLISQTFSGDKTGELQCDLKVSMSGTITFVAAA